MNDSSTVQNPDKTAKNQIITTASGGDNKFLKIALILLAIVMLVVISEVGYFIYTKTKIVPPVVPTSETSPPTSQFHIPEAEASKSINYEKLAHFVNQLEAFRTQANFFQEMDIVSTTSGVVINSTLSSMEVGGKTFVYSISLSDSSDQVVNLFFTAEKVINTKVLLLSEADEEEISLSEIEPGDFVTFKETIDLLDSSLHSKVVLKVRKE